MDGRGRRTDALGGSTPLNIWGEVRTTDGRWFPRNRQPIASKSKAIMMRGRLLQTYEYLVVEVATKT